jgi:hypothetical protein
MLTASNSISPKPLLMANETGLSLGIYSIIFPASPNENCSARFLSVSSSCRTFSFPSFYTTCISRSSSTFPSQAMCTLSSLEAITFKFQEEISNTISEIPSAENSSLESIFSLFPHPHMPKVMLYHFS